MGPTSAELSLLYLLLGIHLAAGTDAVVPASWLVILLITASTGAAWVAIRIVVCVVELIQGRRGVRWGRWMQVACAIGAFFAIHATHWGFAARVRWSEPFLYEEVDRIQSAVAEGRIKDWRDYPRFGTLSLNGAAFTHIELVDILDEGKTILWRTARGDSFFPPPFVWDGGVMYCESGQPPTGWSEFYVDHLYGPWWRWRMGD